VQFINKLRKEEEIKKSELFPILILIFAFEINHLLQILPNSPKMSMGDGFCFNEFRFSAILLMKIIYN